MPLRMAFIGFRHNHILDLYGRAQAAPEIEIVAACEEDAVARQQMEKQGIPITHDSVAAFWREVECDAVAVADYFGRRGALIIEALARGKHVISDKPICTVPGELTAIERLLRAGQMRLGCMLDLRDAAPFIGLRQVIQQGLIGEVQSITFGGQHPLLPGTRPSWYFEEGKHGGTINDIAIHAMDIIPWITGHRFVMINSARCWQGFYRADPHFRDAGQMMLTMDNGCGVLGDVSYFAPDSSGYTLPHYWRMTCWGERGVAEVSQTSTTIWVALAGEKEARQLPLPPARPGGYLEAFLHDIEGTTSDGELATAQVLQASRAALQIQMAADLGICNAELAG